MISSSHFIQTFDIHHSITGALDFVFISGHWQMQTCARTRRTCTAGPSVCTVMCECNLLNQSRNGMATACVHARRPATARPNVSRCSALAGSRRIGSQRVRYLQSAIGHSCRLRCPLLCANVSGTSFLVYDASSNVTRTLAGMPVAFKNLELETSLR